mgnify:CR=1 FL=1
MLSTVSPGMPLGEAIGLPRVHPVSPRECWVEKGVPGVIGNRLLHALWREAMANPDKRMYAWVYNLLSQKGQILPRVFQQLLADPTL